MEEENQTKLPDDGFARDHSTMRSFDLPLHHTAHPHQLQQQPVLPLELLYIVLENFLVHQEPLKLRFQHKGSQFFNPRLVTTLSVLRDAWPVFLTCKALKAEAEQLFWTRNTFAFDGSTLGRYIASRSGPYWSGCPEIAFYEAFRTRIERVRLEISVVDILISFVYRIEHNPVSCHFQWSLPKVLAEFPALKHVELAFVHVHWLQWHRGIEIQRDLAVRHMIGSLGANFSKVDHVQIEGLREDIAAGIKEFLM